MTQGLFLSSSYKLNHGQYHNHEERYAHNQSIYQVHISYPFLINYKNKLLYFLNNVKRFDITYVMLYKSKCTCSSWARLV